MLIKQISFKLHCICCALVRRVETLVMECTNLLCSEVVRYIMEADVKLLPAVAKMLSALATGSYHATCHVIELSLAPIIQQFHKHVEVRNEHVMCAW